MLNFLFLLIIQSNLENIPSNSYIYQELEVLKTYGLIEGSFYSSRPISFKKGYEHFLCAKDKSKRKKNLPNIVLRAIYNLESEFATDLRKSLLTFPIKPAFDLKQDFFIRMDNDTDNTRLRIGANFANGQEKNFAFYNRFEFTGYRKKVIDIVDEGGNKHIPGLAVHSWTGRFSLTIDEAYFIFKIPYFLFQIGRSHLFFGPSIFQSVALSHYAPSLDMILLRGDYDKIRFIAFTSALSRWKEYNRFLSGQRLEISFHKDVQLGINLFAVTSPDSAQTKSFFGIINPLIPIYFEVANSGHDDNLLVGADLAVYFPFIKFYAEFFLDNYELEKKKKPGPDCYAFNLGFFSLLPLNFTLASEYSQIRPYTYNHRIHHIAYIHYDIPLGHPLGPDADEFKLQLGFYPHWRLALQTDFYYRRRGKLNFGSVKNKSYEDSDDPQPPFLEEMKKEILYLPHLSFRAFKYAHLKMGAYLGDRRGVYLRFDYRY